MTEQFLGELRWLDEAVGALPKRGTSTPGGSFPSPNDADTSNKPTVTCPPGQVAFQHPDGSWGCKNSVESVERKLSSPGKWWWILTLQRTKDSEAKQFGPVHLTCSEFHNFWLNMAADMGIDTQRKADGTIVGPLWTSIYFVAKQQGGSYEFWFPCGLAQVSPPPPSFKGGRTSPPPSTRPVAPAYRGGMTQGLGATSMDPCSTDCQKKYAADALNMLACFAQCDLAAKQTPTMPPLPGGLHIPGGTVLPGGLTLPAGWQLPPGWVLPSGSGWVLPDIPGLPGGGIPIPPGFQLPTGPGPNGTWVLPADWTLPADWKLPGPLTIPPGMPLPQNLPAPPAPAPAPQPAPAPSPSPAPSPAPAPAPSPAPAAAASETPWGWIIGGLALVAGAVILSSSHQVGSARPRDED